MAGRACSVKTGRPGWEVILVITSSQACLEQIAARIADAGYTGFAALPSAAPELQAWAAFDLVMSCAHVPAPDPDAIVDQIERQLGFAHRAP